MPPKEDADYFAAKFAASLAERKEFGEGSAIKWFHKLRPHADVVDPGRFIARTVARAAAHQGVPLPIPPPGPTPHLSDEEANKAADALAAGYKAGGIHHPYDSINNVRALIWEFFLPEILSHRSSNPHIAGMRVQPLPP